MNRKPSSSSTDTGVIRSELEKRDGGVCARCRQTFPPHLWEAHHTVPVSEGGGGCDLDGFETLCVACHDDEHRPECEGKPTQEREDAGIPSL